jgi:hypothetical protein
MLTALADRAEREANSGEASAVFNQAALLASDVGLPDLAREWCHRHAHLYLDHHPLIGIDAIRALEPLVNLARIHIRAGRGDHALHHLNQLQYAVTNMTAVDIDGISVPANLVNCDQDRREVREWLWRVLRADGTRALTTVGHWQEALHHIQQQGGIGQRMMDGRQVAVIAATADADHAGAGELLTTTAPGDPWENAVAACLTALCRPPGCPLREQRRHEMLIRHHQIEFDAATAVFHTRLALSIADADQHARPANDALLRDLADHVILAKDAHAARDIVDHDRARSAIRRQRVDALAAVVKASGLDQHDLPTEATRALSSALATAEKVLAGQPANS